MGVNDNSMEQQLERLWEEQGENVGVPQKVRELLNAAFTKVPVSSFPKLPCGKGTCVIADLLDSFTFSFVWQGSCYSHLSLH